LAYANTLAQWFESLYPRIANFRSDIHDHWIFQAIQGFIWNLDLSPFIRAVIRPIFYNCLERNDKSAEALVDYVSQLISSVHEHFHLLPEVLNVFYNRLLSVVDESNVSILIYQMFYEMIVHPCLNNPVMSGVTRTVLDNYDSECLELILSVIQLALGLDSDFVKEPLLGQVRTCPMFSELNPMLVLEDIKQNRAELTLPSLNSFCELVHCAHQPVLFRTLSIE
jgi:hypothetical protein